MVDPDRVVDAARELVHLWQTDAKAALVALEVWPELGEAIDKLGESLAPVCVHPGVSLSVRDIRPGDEIRYPPAPFEDGVDTWTVLESGPDVSRAANVSWRIVAHRLEGDNWMQRAGDHPVSETVTLMRRP